MSPVRSRRMGGARPAARVAAAFAVLLPLVLGAASSGVRAASLPVYGGEIRLPRPAGPLDLDPLAATTPLARTVAHALFDTLFRVGPEGKPVPHLALRHEISHDGLTCRIWLRPEASFHDGTLLTAREVKASLERLLARGSPAWWILAQVEGADAFHRGEASEVQGIAVKGRYEIEIRLARSMPALPLALSSPRSAIARVAAGRAGASVGGAGAPAAGSQASLVGTGPFRYRGTDADGSAVLDAFEEHFAGGPYLDRVRLLPVAGPKEQALALEIGKLDCALADTGAEGSPERGHAFLPIEGTTLFAGIREKGPFAEASVRAALNYAVDRATIVEVLLEGNGEAARGLLPPVLAPFAPVRSAFPYDIDLARALKGGKDRVRAKMLVPAGSPLARRVAERLQVNLLDLGVEVKIEETEPGEARARFRSGEADLLVDSWSPDVPDPALSLAAIAAEWTQSGGDGEGGRDGEDGGGGSPEGSSLLAKVMPHVEASLAAGTATQAVRELFLGEREALVRVPWLLLAHPTAGYLVSPTVAGLESGFGGVLRLEAAWLKPAALQE